MGENEGPGIGVPPNDGIPPVDVTGGVPRPVSQDPRPTGEHEAVEDVYADVASVRWLLPVIAAVVGLGFVVLIVIQFVGSPGGNDDLANGGGEESANGDSSVGGDASTARRSQQELAQAAALQFEQALNAGSLNSLAFAFDEAADVQAEFDAISDGLESAEFAFDVADVVLAEDEIRTSVAVETSWLLNNLPALPPSTGGGDNESVAGEASVDLQGVSARFTTTGTVDVVQVGTEWLVDWSPTVLDERLLPGDALVFDRVPAARAPILGAGGFELVGNRPAIAVGLVPRQVPELAPVAATLARIFQLDEAALLDNLSRSPSDDVFSVTVQRKEDVDQARGELATIPGLVLSETTANLAPSSTFARALLGRTGEATAELIENNPDRFARGDLVGRSGLQAGYNESLAGFPGWRVRIKRQFPLTDESGQPLAPDDPANIVTQVDPSSGTPIQTTIDAAVQEAADQAVGEIQQPTSLVAIRASTGEVLAVANGPSGSTDNFALTGQYPPGSIFKVVTAYAALERGFGPGSEIDCPPNVEVDGREFRNSDFRGFGRVSFRDSFAFSCNTSFVQLALSFDESELPSTARRFGVGADYRLGTPNFAGSVPNPGDRVEQAATSFGQARVLVSPLSMAVMSATAASGVLHTPRLVIDDDEAFQPEVVDTLDAQAVDQLRDMMAAVVDYGTGSAARRVPGGRVHAKTGTAQFGDGNPPLTHAWFTGFQNDVAFAVVVDGGGAGGAVAAPVAADFLRRLNQQ